MYALIVLTFINYVHGESSEIQIGIASEEGMNELKLLALADYIDDNPRLSIFSILISKNGKLVFELYTLFNVGYKKCAIDAYWDRYRSRKDNQ